MIVTSDSAGEPARFLPLEDLERALQALPGAPTDHGHVSLVVSRRDGGRRETPERVRVTPDGGVPGDAWGRQESPQREGQLAVMEIAVARLIAHGQPLLLFGDNLFLDLDLSAQNLPPGTRLAVGNAVLEVTPKAHNGCWKFRGRFGDAALRFVAGPARRHRNLRGIYMCVVAAGEVGPGDAVTVLARGA